VIKERATMGITNTATRALALSACIGLLTFGCGERTEDAGTEDRPTLGFSVFDLQYNFFQEMEKGTREAAEALGFDYKLHDQKSDPAQMISGCENLITRGIDALIVSPYEPSALPPVVRKAKQQGIPVVINDIGGGGADYDVIVISDGYGGGRLAAEYMAEQLETRADVSRKIGILKVEPGHVYAVRRGEGFKARIEELGYTVVSELCAHDRRDEGYRVTQDMMAAHPDLAGVFCENDPMALGAVYAIRDKGKCAIDDVLVVGFNADPEAIEAIQAGHLAATVQQQPDEMGRQCVELARRLIRGENLEYTDPDLREITVPVKLITAADLE
jgi:ribose transport system substrate-binding protein